jgi:hypothetical protein
MRYLGIVVPMISYAKSNLSQIIVSQKHNVLVRRLLAFAEARGKGADAKC